MSRDTVQQVSRDIVHGRGVAEVDAGWRVGVNDTVRAPQRRVGDRRSRSPEHRARGSDQQRDVGVRPLEMLALAVAVLER
jgi:hypothetical protein